ncbi:MAG: NAD(P)H-hydrate dehydratase, partial [Mycobacteriaceae bacterium]|nr:NAD(P)H-hydrate dehydratase [Mycobacteriaceae bacterium]
AARGALRAMPGLVSVFTTERAYPLVASQLAQPMVHPWTPDTRLPKLCSAILFGPGLAGPDVPPAMVQTAVRLWSESPLPVIADASALDWLPAGLPAAPGVRVITPHPGEAGRLLGLTTASVQADRRGALRALTKGWGNIWVVLKGRHTLIGSSCGDIWVNSSGNPGLGQGGSGDVLAGFLGGWLAQSSRLGDVGLAIRYAVWEHGNAADALSVQRPVWEMGELLGLLGSSRGAGGRVGGPLP